MKRTILTLPSATGARQAMHEWQERIEACVRQGQIKRELRPELDGFALASLVISSLEGALVLARLFEDRSHLDFTADHLRRHIADHVSSGPPRGAAEA